MVLTYASLFSGCGGFDLGFSQAGFECVGAFDSDPAAIAVLQRNLPPTASVCDLTHTAPVLKSPPDVLLAGAPCQGFSTVGKRDVDDPRNSLLVLAGHLGVAIRPKVFIAENVVGVVAGQHKRYWDALRTILSSGGYQVNEFCCDASDMGVPQRRRRMLMIGSRLGRTIELNLAAVPGGGVSDALKGVRGAPNHLPVPLPESSDSFKIARRIGQGQKLCNVRSGIRSVHTWEIPEVFGRTSLRERSLLEALLKLRRRNRSRDFGDADPVSAHTLAAFLRCEVTGEIESLVRKGYLRAKADAVDLTHTFNGKYRRLLATSPSPTVDTRFGDPRYFLHPTKHRGLTVREAARLQGFPDSFVFEGPEKAQYRMIGNAVPPPMAKMIAGAVRTVLS